MKPVTRIFLILTILTVALSTFSPALAMNKNASTQASRQFTVFVPLVIGGANDSVLHNPQDIVDIAIADGRFTTLVAAVQAAGLVDTLKSAGPFTVFAPTDEAFAKLPPGTVESLLLPENLETLKQILLYHVVPGKLMAADVVQLSFAYTAAGLPVRIQVKDGKVFINDAQVIITDIQASNGVIHVIDCVLLPPKDIVDTAIADGRFTTLVAAVQAAGLVDTLKSAGPFTVFAPTDEAFAYLPAGTVEELLKPENLEQLKTAAALPCGPWVLFCLRCGLPDKPDDGCRAAPGCESDGW